VPLPEGIAFTQSGDTVTVVNKHRDLADCFALFFLGLVAISAGAGAGVKLGDDKGLLIGVLVTLPAWGFLWLGALRRIANTRTVIAKPGSLALAIGPIPGGGGRALSAADISSVHVKSFENISSTRGATKPLIIKTYSVWVKDKSGVDVCLVEPLDSDAQARFLEKALARAVKVSP
jgi:hypothetical protein